MRHALGGPADTPRHSIITEISTKGPDSERERENLNGPNCERKGERASERERGERSERVRRREEEGKQFLGIFTTSSWRSDIFFLAPSFSPRRGEARGRGRGPREGVIAGARAYIRYITHFPTRSRVTTDAQHGVGICARHLSGGGLYPYRDPRTPRAQ